MKKGVGMRIRRFIPKLVTRGKPVGLVATGLEEQLAGGGLWGRGRTELDDRGRQGI